MTRRLITLTFLGGAATLALSLAQAAQPVQLMVGNPSAQNIVLSFAQRGAEGIRIETHQVGDPGAKLSIWVDRDPNRLFSRVLTTSDCKYGDDGARCRIAIARKSSEYARFIFALKRGKTLHVEVQNAGVMQMDSKISLIGFVRKLGRQT